ncbi:MAG: divalent metal cation transporter [Acidobacteriota bacterium]|nr:divalent metal cation transporter [Acidobacteriota bacterium]
MTTILVDLLLGIVTSIGSFVEVGSISTAAKAGSEFGFDLLWAIAGAAFMLALLTEMSGRLAVMSKRTLAEAVRERFGIHFQSISLSAELVLDVLLLSAQIGGAAIAIKLLTGIGFQWWILPVGFAVWLVLFTCGFGIIENGIGLLGLVTLSFVYAAFQLGPEPGALAAGLVPAMPDHDRVRYAFLAVSILGATVTPHVLNFYSSGTIEEKLPEKYLWVNTTTSYLGTCFGAVVSMGVLVASALTLGPLHITVDSYEQAALMFAPVFGRWAVTVFALSLGIGCFGAAVEMALNGGYVMAQVFGWSWGAEQPRRDAARFTSAFTFVLVVSVALALVGFDPLQVTMISVALTVVILPIVVLPFLVLMNDPKFVQQHTSGRAGNLLLAALTVLAALLAIVVIPLQVLGG